MVKSDIASTVDGVNDLYGSDILSWDPHRDGAHARRPRSREVHLEIGMVLEDVETGFVGAVVRVEKSGGVHVVELEDRHRNRRSFPLGGGFWIDGSPIIACAPLVKKDPTSTGLVGSSGRPLTNSGSRADRENFTAQVARQSRIWVEGTHDAALIEHVWGEDLAHCGTVIQVLHGVDHLADVLEVFGPSASCRAGVLLDHMVAGSKEARIAREVTKRWGESILVVGHRYVDIWQAIKPERVGLRQWPNVPRDQDIKVGTLAALGWAHQTPQEIAQGWSRILSRVRNYQDLEHDLLGCVEQLIDFVTGEGTM